MDATAEPRSAARDWTINGDFVALKPHGVARYAREVVLALDRLAAERHPLTEGLRLHLVVPRPPIGLELRAIAIETVPEFRTPRLPQLWVQLQLPRQLRGGLISLCNLAPIAVRRQIVCIHDMHTRMEPQSYGAAFRLAHRLILPTLGRRAAAITTVSGFSRAQLARFGIAPEEAITIAPDGADHTARWHVRWAAEAPPGQRPFILALGQRQTYKNMGLLARLAAPLDALGLDLVIAGEPPAVAFAHAPANVRLLGRVDDRRLAELFTTALCLVFPSRLEGFGLPSIEAMACGCPVIAAAAGALPEVCGPAALYAHPDDDGAWIASVRRLRDDRGLRISIRAAGFARAARYSWQGTAEVYLALMARLDGLAPVAAHKPVRARMPAPALH